MKWAARVATASEPYALVVVAAAVAWLAVREESLVLPPALVIGDVAVGATLIAASIVVRRADATAGRLLAATALTWFVGSLFPMALYWHRAPMIQLLLRSGPSRTKTARTVAIVAGYAVSVLPQFWNSPAVTLVLGAALMAIAVLTRTPRAERITACVLGSIVMMIAVAWLVFDLSSGLAALLVYDGAMIAGVVIVSAGLRRRSAEHVTDVIVELAESVETLRGALARAIGDPTLRVAYWDAGLHRYVFDGDATGSVHRGPSASTLIDVDGDPAVLIEHAAGALDDAPLREAVTTSVRMTVRNAELRHRADERNAQLEESRRRLLLADDAARVELRDHAERGVLPQLNALEEQVVAAQAAGSPVDPDRVSEMIRRIETIRTGIDDALDGIAPAGLGSGLVGAITSLADQTGVSLSIRGRPPRVPQVVEVALVFAIAETVTNALKHASADVVGIELTGAPEAITVRVHDDGIGGADQTGSGIVGVADRVRAVGGTFDLESTPGGGTVVRMTVPAATTAATSPRRP